MPLAGSGDVLAAAIMAAIEAVPDKSVRDDVFKAMAAAITAHIVANAVVVVTSVGGVTVGAGVSGPGAGTIV